MINYIYKAGCGEVIDRKVTHTSKKDGTILYHHAYFEDDVKMSWTADPLDRIKESKYLFLDRSEAEKRADEIYKNYKDKKEKLNNGYIECAQCGKLIKKEEAVTDVVISRMYKNNRKEFEYCSGKCAKHNQMAHEG
jgi:hypothetical protein